MESREVDIVASGSGARLFVFIGALLRLAESGHRFRRLCGTSGGSIVLAKLASVYDPADPMRSVRQLEAFAQRINPAQLLDPNWFGGRWWEGRNAGNKVLAELRAQLPPRFDNLALPLNVVTHDLTSRRTKVWGKADVGVDLPLVVRASMSLPLVFDAVFLRGHVHVDGGVSANYPLDLYGDGDGVIGLRFRPTGGGAPVPPGEDGGHASVYRHKHELWGAILDDMLEATSRLHMSAATKARTIMLDYPGSSFDFDVGPGEITAQIDAGWESVGEWLKEKR